MSQHRVYALASGKGGVGKTTSAVNLGAALVDAGHTVVVVDTDLGMANVGDVLDIDADGPSLHEVLADEATIEEATYNIGRFGVVPGGTELEAYAEADPARLGPALEALRERFDYVLLDVGAGLSHDTVLPLGLADAVLLITTPDRPSIENARKVAAVAERLDGTVEGVVITRAGADDDAATLVESTLTVPLLAVVPEDEAVARSVEAGVPVVVTDPDAPVSTAYAGLAAALDGRAFEEAPATPADATATGSPGSTSSTADTPDGPATASTGAAHDDVEPSDSELDDPETVTGAGEAVATTVEEDSADVEAEAASDAEATEEPPVAGAEGEATDEETTGNDDGNAESEPDSSDDTGVTIDATPIDDDAVEGITLTGGTDGDDHEETTADEPGQDGSAAEPAVTLAEDDPLDDPLAEDDPLDLVEPLESGAQTDDEPDDDGAAESDATEEPDDTTDEPDDTTDEPDDTTDDTVDEPDATSTGEPAARDDEKSADETDDGGAESAESTVGPVTDEASEEDGATEENGDEDDEPDEPKRKGLLRRLFGRA